MFKKTLLFTALASVIFANPVVNSVATRFDVPIPSCYPCGPGEKPGQPLLVATLDVPIPSCYPCGPGEKPGQPA